MAHNPEIGGSKGEDPEHPPPATNSQALDVRRFPSVTVCMCGYFDQHYLPKLSDPILVVGLPSLGVLGCISAEKVIEATNAKCFADYYSDFFPDFFEVGSNGLGRLPCLEFSEASTTKPNLIVLTGRATIVSDVPQSYYYVFDEILQFAKGLGVKVAYVLDALSSEHASSRKFHVAASDRRLLIGAEKHSGKILSEARLQAVPSVILGLSRFHRISALLVAMATEPQTETEANAKELLRFVFRITGLSCVS